MGVKVMYVKNGFVATVSEKVAQILIGKGEATAVWDRPEVPAPQPAPNAKKEAVQ